MVHNMGDTPNPNPTDQSTKDTDTNTNTNTNTDTNTQKQQPNNNLNNNNKEQDVSAAELVDGNFVNEDLSFDDNIHDHGDRGNDEETQHLDHDKGLTSSTKLITERDKSAVCGLLALGGESISTLPLPIPVPDTTRISQSSLLIGNENPPIPTQTEVITEDEKIQLLCNYRYKVALWLDIYDLSHPFGISAVQMAMKSGAVMGALLELSRVCALNQDAHSTQGVESSIEGISSDYDGILTTEVALTILLREVRYLVSDLSRGWKTMRRYNPRIINSLIHRAFTPGIEGSIYWMFFRLDLSTALATNTPIQIPLPIPNLSTQPNTQTPQEKTHTLLYLCAQALKIHHQQNTPPHHWLEILKHLEQWYHLRPPEFLPIVDSPHTTASFPILLFVNGAGIFTNQIYHTAMLLLLECKPRTVLSGVHSALWHAQRLCGIAMNNNRQESWDPCLLASLLVAARRMSFQGQRGDILAGLERIKKVTGWRVDGYLAEWDFDSGGS
ncbi:hypothetical protein BO94DRAFT_578975 [Aspergillus sclerotioniger CBS 115572]|uniref:Zn(II)2Cys6 transcription factor n=1 Tax=Aspergillus sclerotioniger CBS 115572 TaxID=1450535 RepID=A0A317VBJ4_9EURO|nr:hypothetical protein BO94DRAFT_578975 [Aspergillus sclerotioniger CBS 115572]PWY70322.1 hypothetical protein BO94DRAFT_578975 [Aspergillus sclerotioniger CBS 115572]